MDKDELVAYLVFVSYFLLIFLSFGLVFRSILSGQDVSKLFEGRAFYFLRTAVGALLCTWYFMFRFMAWSYDSYSIKQVSASFGRWLVDTALFEQAWTVVCSGPANWWWSSWICTWTVVFTAIVWSESGRRGIKYPYAYMLLGQLVAISVSTALFLVAISLHPRIRPSPRTCPVYIAFPLLMAFLPIYLLPKHVGTNKFMDSLLWLHGALLLPLTSSSTNDLAANAKVRIPFTALYGMLIGAAVWIHKAATEQYLASLRSGQSANATLYKTIFSHPAQGSISLDVIWVGIILISWSVLSGPALFRLVKGSAVVLVLGTAVARLTGVNWGLLASIIPILILFGFGSMALSLQRLRAKNLVKRRELLEKMGMPEETLVQGTSDKAPQVTGKKVVVGFWHPYCNAGGGGERVLWTAIRHLQRTERDLLVLVYSGDYPAATKQEIIDKVKTRFSISLDPARLHFIPLPSRYLISDDFWKRFTLLNQSLGSVVLAWEGLFSSSCPHSLPDSMGYGFTYPFTRLIAGSDIAIGTYTHYPTVSTDMVKRVRERVHGVENAGASKSAVKTQIKLVYYRIFTSLYSVSLLFSQHIMTNSSWTQAHIQSLLTAEERGEAKEEDRARCEVVYPPCDTKELVKLGNLDKRKKEIISLAQFRPEKEHAKQIHALSALFDKYPQHRDGPKRVTLAMMGGARNAQDEERLSGLKALAEKLGVRNNVEFIVNAPYPEVVQRLGQASVGLNTMMDEHFGINVVEFMAAGLIPVVHASAGPVMDIVVPYNGRQTGYHATDAESFAEAIHSAFSLSDKESLAMRKAARDAAVHKFSEAEFEKAWEKGWFRLKDLASRAERGS
ncbi:alpha-1,2-mannosyltransferase [Kwoniella heveanensis CBS 569]|nr:alpha-1,2-mannosyltransferase [Kwoniella heveanensis CBS 569]